MPRALAASATVMVSPLMRLPSLTKKAPTPWAPGTGFRSEVDSCGGRGWALPWDGAGGSWSRRCPIATSVVHEGEDVSDVDLQGSKQTNEGECGGDRFASLLSADARLGDPDSVRER